MYLISDAENAIQLIVLETDFKPDRLPRQARDKRKETSPIEKNDCDATVKTIKAFAHRSMRSTSSS